jgi:hypothetical protein
VTRARLHKNNLKRVALFALHVIEVILMDHVVLKSPNRSCGFEGRRLT